MWNIKQFLTENQLTLAGRLDEANENVEQDTVTALEKMVSVSRFPKHKAKAVEVTRGGTSTRTFTVSVGFRSYGTDNESLESTIEILKKMLSKNPIKGVRFKGVAASRITPTTLILSIDFRKER